MTPMLYVSLLLNVWIFSKLRGSGEGTTLGIMARGAIASADKSMKALERTLGKGLRDEFIKYKTEEWEAYHLSVSQWEVDRYSHMF